MNLNSRVLSKPPSRHGEEAAADVTIHGSMDCFSAKALRNDENVGFRKKSSIFSDLLKKYDKPGPRYTSYPTVPVWSENVGNSEYAVDLKKINSQDRLSLYFHLPFCETLCHFCGCFQVATKDHSRSAPYVRRLLREMELVLEHLPARMKVSQIHFGGGTPNFMMPDEISCIMEKVRREFDVESDAEIAIEMHPRTSTRAFCDRIAELQFNRISLGVQDLDPKVQKLINRHQTYEMTLEMVEYLRSLGFQSFNFDLVYGLPGQSFSGWGKTLEQVLNMKPNRLAIYSYAHVPWVKPVQRTFEDSDIPKSEMKIALFEMAYQYFSSRAYLPIGTDHFALETDELALALKSGGIHRNFMGYSTRGDAHQIGFGMSAISFVTGNYYQNHKMLKTYELLLDSNHLATFRGKISHLDDRIRRDVITQLMCTYKIRYADFREKWDIDFEDYFASELQSLDCFVQDNLMKITNTGFETLGFSHVFLRNMAMEFDPYLKELSKQTAAPIFSRTM